MATSSNSTNLGTRAANAASVMSPGTHSPMSRLQLVQRRSVRSPLPRFIGPTIQTVMNRPLPAATAAQRVTSGVRTATGSALRQATGRVITPNQVTSAITGNIGHNLQAALRNFTKSPLVTVRRAIGK